MSGPLPRPSSVTMTTARSDTWVRRAGFACGIVAVGAMLAAARVPAQPNGLGLDLSVVPAPSATLTIKPLRPLIVASGMRAGGRRSQATGSTTIINPSQQAQRVRVRALPSTHALDNSLQVDVRLAGKPIYHGPVQGLRTATRESIVLLSGNSAPVRVHVALPDGASGWRGRIEDVDLAFDTQPVISP
jgi:hypothetical protein